MDEQERLQILEMIEKGVISASEGVRLLNSLQGEPDETTSESPQTESIPDPLEQARYAQAVVEEMPVDRTKAPPVAQVFESGVARWRRWWWVPLTAGIIITVVSGLLMYSAYLKSGFGFWSACLWFPLLLGILVMGLSAASRTARWLHVRIQQAPGEKPQSIGISMPIPIRFTAWIMRIIKPRIPGMDNINLDEALMALENVSPEQPFYVKVDEDDSGEKVEVFIG